MAIKYKYIREKVIEAGKKMLESSLVVGTWGNISARVLSYLYIYIFIRRRDLI